MNIASVNAVFELVGAILAWRNAYAAYLEKPKGIYWPTVAFSVLWGVECIPYYLEHHDKISCVFSTIRCAGSAVWCVLALRNEPK